MSVSDVLSVVMVSWLMIWLHVGKAAIGMISLGDMGIGQEDDVGRGRGRHSHLRRSRGSNILRTVTEWESLESGGV